MKSLRDKFHWAAAERTAHPKMKRSTLVSQRIKNAVEIQAIINLAYLHLRRAIESMPQSERLGVRKLRPSSHKGNRKGRK